MFSWNPSWDAHNMDRMQHYPRSKVAVVTMAKDEEEFLPGLVAAMAKVTPPPLVWLIWNDGSEDETPAIADEAAELLNFVRVVHHDSKHRGFAEDFSCRIQAAIDEALGSVDAVPQCVAILDADMLPPADYFYQVEEQMTDDMAIASGQVTVGGRPERQGGVARGGARLVRADFLSAIGGIPAGPCWDALLDAKAVTRNLRSVQFNHPSIAQRRPTAATYGSWRQHALRGRFLHHVGCTLIDAAGRGFLQAGLPGAAGTATGFVGQVLARKSRTDDLELLRHYRSPSAGQVMSGSIRRLFSRG